MFCPRRRSKMEQINQFVAGLIILICCMKCASAAIDPPSVDNLESTTSLFVTWNLPVDCTSETVNWYLSSDGTLVDSESVASNATSYLIEGLTAGTLYDVSVSATDTTDNSTSESGITQGRTNPNSVTFSLVEANTTFITVQWMHPGGFVEYFEVTCSGGGMMDSVDNITDTTASDYVAMCTLPIAGVPYTITVTSVSGDTSNSTSEDIGADMTMPTRVDLMPQPSTTTTISVMWISPLAVDNYLVICSDGSPSPSANLPASAVSASCTGVTPGGNHSIMVITVHNEGNSSAAVAYIVAIPEKAANLTETDATTTAFTVKWDAVGMVDEYEVTCNSGTATPGTVPATDENLVASCTNLDTPGATYRMDVVSVSNMERSEAASLNVTAYPNSVLLTLKGANSSHITVTWNDTGGVVEYFEVMCGSEEPVENIPYTGLSTYEVTCKVPTAGASYIITVTSVSGDKSSPTTEAFNVPLPDGVVLIPLPSTTTTISVEWNSPSAVDNYLVFCSDGSPSPSANLPASAVTASCTDVTPGGNHSITVITVHNGGNSSAAVAYIVAIPEKAANLTETDATTTTAFTVAWDPAVGMVDEYEVTCDIGTATPGTIPGNEAREASCINLDTPGATYRMDVVSVSNTKRSEAASLNVTALPEKAANLTEIFANTTAFTVAWDQAPGMVDEYNVTCDNGTPTPSVVPSTGPLEASCTNLDTPGATYRMDVVSVSNMKTSEEPAFLLVTAFPNSVKLTPGASTTSSVNASWEHPDGQVDSFQVFCGTNDTDPEEIKNVTTDEIYELTCENLTVAGDGYAVSVFSISGDKNSSAEIMLYTLPNEVMLEPQSATTTSVTATWRRPNGLVDDYNVSCSPGVPDGPNGPVDDVFSASCVNLPTPGDSYTLTVTSISNGQENSASIILTALPLSVSLQQNVSTTTSVSATWEDPGGIVEFYEVSCDNGTVNQSNVSDSQYLASCDGVWNPGDNYTMTVTSDSNGQTNKAEIVLTALPLMADDLGEFSANTSSVTASWKEPRGKVEYYDITCSAGNATPPRVDSMADPLQASCDGLLIPGDDYDIVVTSVSYGQRGENASITITALPAAVTLNRGVSTTDSISASWMHPGGVVDTFNITCSNGTAEPPSYVVNETNVPFTASCIDLPTPGENYTLLVVAYSNNKSSAVSSISDLALPAGVELREGNSTTTSVSALWDRPNGIVQSYEIECDRGVADPSIINDTSADSYQASCLDLSVPGDDYRLTVFSIVEGSKNSSSGFTLVAVPEAVETFTVARYNTSSVTVSWTLKSCPECVYTRFEIEHDPDGNGSLSVDHEMDQNSYSLAISDLTPGRNFEFTIVSVSVGQNVENVLPKISAPMMATQRTEPASPTDVTVTAVTTTTIDISWTKAEGDVGDYRITLDPLGGTSTFNGNLSSPAARVEGLTSGVNYIISVTTVSGDLTSVPTNITQRTDTSPSGPVGNPQANAINITTINVTYDEPEEPNGIIERYQISYVGTREGRPTDPDTVETTTLSYLFTSLIPGYNYRFTIIAFNDGGHEGMPATTEASTPEADPPPVREDYPYSESTSVPVINTNSLTVILPDDLFNHENGEITSFDVIVSQENDASTVANVTISYQQAERLQQNGIWPPYVTLKDEPYPYPLIAGSRRRKRAAVLTTRGEVEIGTEDPCPSSGYCNGRLRDNTRYYYAFRANNGGGSTPSGYFGPVITVKYVNVGAIVGSVVPITILLIAGAIFGVFYFRKQRIPRGERVPPNGLENAAFIGEEMPRRPLNRKAGSSMYKKSFSRPLHLNTFEEHYNMMKADSEYRFSEEYEEIRPVGRDQPTTSATLDMNRAKNRFTNILPYEHSRVKLLAIDDEEGSDYINANFMPGYNSPREFIAAQGPLPGTLDDMWRMIWEKKTSIIVMLTQLVEKGRVKCHQYWPADYKPIMYGSIEVSLQSEENFEHWIVREFTLVKDENKRKLTQFHFMSWPDHGVPQNTESMLSFVRTVRDHMPQNNKPVVVHCSAGVGRTGTYITLDRLTQHMQENDFIDIFGIICEMRMQRNYMVQTEKQYIFIHECVMDLIRSSAEYVNTIYDDVDGDVNDNVADEAV